MDGNNRQREAEAEFPVDLDFHSVDAEAGELDAAEDMHIRGMGVEGGEVESDLAGGDGFIVLGVEDRGLLRKFPDPTAPAGPEAEFKKTERDRRGGDDSDDADEGLLAAGFLPDILAKETRLKIWQDGLGHDG